MTRRLTLALAALAVLTISAMTISSCTTFERNDAVAEVNGVQLTKDEFQSLIADTTVMNILQATGGDPVAGPDARRVISTWLIIAEADRAGSLALANPTDVQSLIATLPPEAWAAMSAEGQSFITQVAQLTIAEQAGLVDIAALNVQLSDSDVYVDSRFGRWDPATISVVALAEA